MRVTGRRSSISRIPLLLSIALSLVTILTRPGSAEAPLEPGLFLEYRVELREGGQLHEESFRLEVLEASGPGIWQLELLVGKSDRYRCEYELLSDGGPFSPSRFGGIRQQVEGRWELIDGGAVPLLDDLDRMQSQLAGTAVVGDSLFSIDGVAWPAQGHAVNDSISAVQSSESVTLTRITRSRGWAWLSPDLPFGGWLSYEEERRARKISEFAGRRFEGEEAISRELWRLVSVGVKN